MLLGMKTKPNPTDTLVINLRALMRANKIKTPQLATQSGVSIRMIKYILAGERKPTVELANALAKPFGITGWQIIMPGLPIELAKSGRLDKLIHNYSESQEKGRTYIDRVAEHEATYKVGNSK